MDRAVGDNRADDVRLDDIGDQRVRRVPHVALGIDVDPELTVASSLLDPFDQLQA